MKKVIVIFLLLGLVLLCFLYYFNVIPHAFYDNAYFHIETYQSLVDKDLDGVEDQRDILENALTYIEKRPKYKSQYYSDGYPDDEYGVCTDVVGYALLHAGYDLQKLVDEDIRENKEIYGIDQIDSNIDFRRVVNLEQYFKRNHLSLTLDLKEIHEWQGGDIVVFPGHIGVISAKRNCKGIPFLIHHSNPYQVRYEEDVLERYEIIGHYRIS